MIKEIFSFDLYEKFIEDVSASAAFADPHFEFDHRNLFDSLKKANRKAYVVTEGEKVSGLFVWLILPDEKYVEMLIGLSREESSIREMLAHMEDECRGYQLDFVINPQHDVFCSLLKGKNARFEEEQQWMAWEKELDADNQYQNEIMLLPREYEAQYIARHHQDTYWIAEKVMEAKERFRVFVAIHEEKVVGYLDVTYCYERNEPYDLWVDNAFHGKGYEQALLQAAINMNKPGKMMVLVDVSHNDEIEMYNSIGFVPAPGTNSVYATYKT